MISLRKRGKLLGHRGEPSPNIQNYQFTAAQDLYSSFEDTGSEAHFQPSPQEGNGFVFRQEGAPAPNDPISFAQIQADQILRDARAQAEEILEQARRDAQAVADAAREEGFQQGLQEGILQGASQAMEQADLARETRARETRAAIDAFLEKAEAALEKQLQDNVEQLRDLALAVAEKIICISLKSSGDVISRMIETAIDKRRRREWVHIYVAECDAKHLASMTTGLTQALSQLSDRVRIIPMADDEPGTCIVECPDEIIDASASTQLQNIREMLDGKGGSGFSASLNLREGGLSNRVP